jgi:hypothetical protein
VVEAEIERLKDLLRQRIQDSMVTSQIREELNFQVSIWKEDKIIMTGLTCQIFMSPLA